MAVSYEKKSIQLRCKTHVYKNIKYGDIIIGYVTIDSDGSLYGGIEVDIDGIIVELKNESMFEAIRS